MSVDTKPFQFAQGVDNIEDAKLYLSVFMEENGVQGLIEGLQHLAKNKGMTALAEEAGVNRQSLYRSLSKNGNPKLETVDKILRSLGFKLTVEKI